MDSYLEGLGSKLCLISEDAAIEPNEQCGDEEIKVVPRGDKAPASVQPSPKDPWQWQRFIRGTEYSAWFVCVEGRITFQGCYRSEGDLLFFDGIPVPDDVEAAISGLVSKHRLTGQYAFDYFREESSG